MANDSYAGQGANGGCYFEVEKGNKKEHCILNVGWSCVTVHREEIPVTWLSELVAIATDHKDGIAGFLHEAYGDRSYALQCDPPEKPLVGFVKKEPINKIKSTKKKAKTTCK